MIHQESPPECSASPPPKLYTDGLQMAQWADLMLLSILASRPSTCFLDFYVEEMIC